MLGSFFPGKEPLPWNRPLLSREVPGERRETGKTSQCCLLSGNVSQRVLLCGHSIYSNCLSYKMMGQCWKREPEKRLTFSELVTVISSSLEDMSGYLDLTTPSLTAEHILSGGIPN